MPSILTLLKNKLADTLFIYEGFENRNRWIESALSSIPSGGKILDAGAGEQRCKPYCHHLHYVSQDFCQYDGQGDGSGLQPGRWDTSKIDIVCDITNIPEPDASYDAVLCCEVLEHLPDPISAVREFSRLLKPGGVLIMTAPFATVVHFAPYFYATGFSRHWYEYHLPRNALEIRELSPNGDWFSVLRQELFRLPSVIRSYSKVLSLVSYLLIAPLQLLIYPLWKRSATADIATLGWHCIAVKMESGGHG